MPDRTGPIEIDTKPLQSAADLARMLSEANLDDPAQRSLFASTDRLPFHVWRSVLSDQEWMGNDIGLIRRIHLRDETSPEARRKKEEARQRKIWKWLQEMIRYAQLFWDVAFKVAVADKAVEIALADISLQRSLLLARAGGTMGAFETVSDPAGEIAALDQTAERLTRFRQNVIQPAQTKLEAAPPPATEDLKSIDRAIESERRATPAFARAFEYVMEHAVAPAAAYAYQHGIKPAAESLDARIAAMRARDNPPPWHPERPSNQNDALTNAFAQSGASGDDEVEDGDGKGDVKSVVLKKPAIYPGALAVAVDPE